MLAKRDAGWRLPAPNAYLGSPVFKGGAFRHSLSFTFFLSLPLFLGPGVRPSQFRSCSRTGPAGSREPGRPPPLASCQPPPLPATPPHHNPLMPATARPPRRSNTRSRANNPGCERAPRETIDGQKERIEYKSQPAFRHDRGHTVLAELALWGFWFGYLFHGVTSSVPLPGRVVMAVLIYLQFRPCARHAAVQRHTAQ